MTTVRRNKICSCLSVLPFDILGGIELVYSTFPIVFSGSFSNLAHVANIMKMCMWLFNGDKIYIDISDLLNFVILDWV